VIVGFYEIVIRIIKTNLRISNRIFTMKVSTGSHGSHAKNTDLYNRDSFPDEGSEGRFGRLFPVGDGKTADNEHDKLRPHPSPRYDLDRLGKAGGPLKSTGRADSHAPAGMTFLGQFIDHDITLDVTTSLTANANINTLQNGRSPALDLDNIYGQGPEAQPYLYVSEKNNDFSGIKLLTGADIPNASELQQNDLLRSLHGRAIIGDPRNDENGIISQLQLAIIRFHNSVVDELSTQYSGHKLFEEARKLTTWHYQWVVIHDFLKKMCGNAVVNEILGGGRQFYTPKHGDPFIPVEFSVAAYRFGHSMIPQKIQIQKNESALELFGTLLGRGFEPLSDLKGVVDWLELVDSSAGRNVQKAEKLDTKMATDLLKLPFIPPTSEQSLATRNLLRGQSFLLPSGEKIAEAMNRSASEIDTVNQQAKTIAGPDIDLSTGTPLWFYLLTEAEVIGKETMPNQFEPGEGLGPVGARIVSETLIGLIEVDPRSFLATNRNWEPSDGLNVKKLADILTYQ